MPSKNSLHSVRKDTNNNESPVLDLKNTPAYRKPSKPKVIRLTKGFQVEKSRAHKWDLLVAQMKGAEDKKTGPELIDEALDYLFDKYSTT